MGGESPRQALVGFAKRPMLSPVQSKPPRFMESAKAAEVLRSTLDPKVAVTVADAAAKGGLALRDAELGLQALTSEYRGQLRVTNDGQLLYRFPTGFTKPWETRDAIDRAFASAGRTFVATMRFLARAWIAIVLVGYTAVFVSILIAMSLSSRDNNNSRRSSGGEFAYILLRALADAFFWTSRPFSRLDPYERVPVRRGRDEPKVPLYERVNRFLFGPTRPPEDPRLNERLVIAAIRAGKGRIGLADVMRVTGLPREHADPMMARLMLDYEGDVSVSEEGGIFYSFPAMRKTTNDTTEPEPPPIWSRAVTELGPFTGNSFAANFVVALLNGFNLLMGIWSIENGMTIERFMTLFERIPRPFVDTGLPIALGVIPLVFSAFLFAIPLARAIGRPIAARKAKHEKGRLAVLREVLERTRAKRPIQDAVLTDAWERATGAKPDTRELTRDLTALGGDVEMESGQARWRFVDLETEAAAVEAEREAASEEERKLEAVVFSTESDKLS